MKVTFIYHSCYTVELSDKVLIFDYYKGELPEFDVSKKIYFFVSHSHFDHFNEKIFDLYSDHERHYILSSDCCAVENEIIHTMLNDDELIIDDVSIKTIPSNDLGVAYIIKTNGLSIYHAGDLNAWCFEEYGKEDNHFMAKEYRDYLEKIKGEKFDLAFVPLDARLKGNAELGLDIFSDYCSSKAIFPIHMNDTTYQVVTLYIYSHNGKTKIEPVTKEGYVYETPSDKVVER